MDKLNQNVALNLKRLRKGKRMSLDALAAETGISKSMLGQIERGIANPTIGTVGKIIKGLQVTLSELVGPPPTDTFIIHKETMMPIKAENGKYRNYNYFPYNEDRSFEIYSIEIEPGANYSAAPHPDYSKEYLIVSVGELSLIEGDEMHILKEGDAICFNSDRPHVYENNGSSYLKLHIVYSWDD